MWSWFSQAAPSIAGPPPRRRASLEDRTTHRTTGASTARSPDVRRSSEGRGKGRASNMAFISGGLEGLALHDAAPWIRIKTGRKLSPHKRTSRGSCPKRSFRNLTTADALRRISLAETGRPVDVGCWCMLDHTQRATQNRQRCAGTRARCIQIPTCFRVEVESFLFCQVRGSAPWKRSHGSSF